MADDTNTNPFLSDEDDFLENVPENDNKLKVNANESQEVTWDSIASKLLKEKLTLTALELHTELVEAGRELPRLRDFFSNPGNFERSKEDSPPSTLPRTSSIQTFDSLDFARYSDDGERQVDERVAVLEFELRKAQDTIKSLRASLTKETENEHVAQETMKEEGREGLFTDDTIRPMEKKAINFVVNEYLLQINNKITAVTFSEENEDQNFEDWDDVGLNVPQPPPLLHLYRDYNNHVMPDKDVSHVECQTEADDNTAETLQESVKQLEEELATVKKHLGEKITDLEGRLLYKDKEIIRQRGVAEGSESDPPSPLQEQSIFDDIPPGSYSPDNQSDLSEEEDLQHCDCDHSLNEKCPVCVRVQSPEVYRLDFTDEGDQSADQEVLDQVNDENETGNSENVTKKVVNDTEKPPISDKSDKTVVNPDNSMQESSNKIETENSGLVAKQSKTVVQMSKDLSSGIESKENAGIKAKRKGTKSKDIWTDSNDTSKKRHDISDNRTGSKSSSNSKKGKSESQGCETEKSGRKMSNAFSKELKDVCFNVPKDNRIILEVSQITDTDTQNVILMLSRCLPHIVPNVLLAKREELIPLIICTAMLHPDSKERDKLLNILFNLIKKPDEEQRHMILTGCIAFAHYVGPTRVEAELLPQCWEQISHKYMERRLLVAEACGALAGYIPSELRSSLVLSMLQQMLQDDKEADVREAVVRSLGLIIGFIYDKDKYPQGSELLKMALKDSAEKVVTSAMQIFLPSFAMWAYELGKLEHSLLHGILRDLEELDVPFTPAAITSQKSPGGMIPLNEGRFLLHVTTLEELVPFLYVSVLESGPYIDKLPETMASLADGESTARITRSKSPLTDMTIIAGNRKRLVAMVKLFEEHIDQEWFEPWDNLSWVVNNLIPRLLEVVMGSAVTFPRIVSCLAKCFYKISTTFGKTFVDKKVKPRFIDVLMMGEEHIDPSNSFTSNTTPFTTCVVPVYASGVLSAFNTEEDKKQLSQFLREALFCLSLYQAPKDSLKIAVTELCANSSNHELLLEVLWEGVVHSSPQVRATAARLFEIVMHSVNESLASARCVPALITLGSDPVISVRVATIPALGTIIETVTTRDILEKVYMQLQTFLDDPIYREEHALHLELVSTFARVGPNAEQKFRDEFMLPRLTAMALENNNQTNDVKKKEMALQLFEAYSALSCCFINYQLVQEAMLPGLRCLKQDMSQIAPEHEEVIASMIKEYQSKIETSRPADKSSSFTGNFAATGEDMKARMMNKLKESTTKANISSLFNRKK
ncbi:RAB11-binding protein RELCH homolog isoform X2 [Ruditapes philippinarum]|uniref:RAB11-binding protein RELCH homolog isoform X2 n=1 Tax=Ruditapes philippinarum TaxID=129788 RepID=UPI00295BCD8D|nr:RAB11-binding protein RELCH homolog isoform X2 [Ruditapes philippinarum]